MQSTEGEIEKKLKWARRDLNTGPHDVCIAISVVCSTSLSYGPRPTKSDDFFIKVAGAERCLDECITPPARFSH